MADRRRRWEFSDQNLSGWVACLCAAADVLERVHGVPRPESRRPIADLMAGLVEAFHASPSEPGGEGSCDEPLPGNLFVGFEAYLAGRGWSLSGGLNPADRLQRHHTRSLGSDRSAVEIGHELARCVADAARSLTLCADERPTAETARCANDLFWKGIVEPYEPRMRTAARRLLFAMQYDRAHFAVLAGRHRVLALA